MRVKVSEPLGLRREIKEEALNLSATDNRHDWTPPGEVDCNDDHLSDGDIDEKPCDGLTIPLVRKTDKHLGHKPACVGTTNYIDLPEMNSNTNGTTADTSIFRGNSGDISGIHDNMNDNRHQVLTEIPIMKKVKQIKMNEVPLHLSGLCLSGSGLQLFVKVDEHLENALHTKPKMLQATKLPKSRRKTTKAKRKGNDLPVNLSRDSCATNQGLAPVQIGYCVNEAPVVGGGNFTRTNSIPESKDKTEKDDSEMAELLDNKIPEPMRLQNRPTKTRSHTYGCYQNFQPLPLIKSNVISGPTWNVDNGHIDVINSQDNLPTSSRHVAQHNNTPANKYDMPIDCSLNPFLGGFKSTDLPLKRRFQTSRWRGSTSPCFLNKQPVLCNRKRRHSPCSCASSDFEDGHRNDVVNNIKHYDNIYDLTKNNLRENNTAERKIKVAVVKNVNMAPISGEDLITRQSSPMSAQPKVSDMNQSEQSSLGPKFDTDRLTSQTIDTETVVKFTQYTRDLRQDLKQKYKDISKLVKSFEQAVQQRSSDIVTEQAESTATSHEGNRCIVM